MTTDILYIVSRLRPSGPISQLYYTLQHLDDDFNANILTLSPEPEDTELPRFQKLGIDYETLGLSRWKGLLYGPKQLREIIAKHDPDIVHTHGIRADTLSALFISEYPRITTIHNYPYDDYPAKFGTIQGNVMAVEHTQMIQRIDHPIACSETIADMMQSHGIDATPIQNGVDTETYSPVSDAQKSQLRRNLNISESATIFVSIGSLISRKNPTDVIKGFQRADLEDSTLLMLSDGPLKEKCERLAAGDDRIRIEGWVDNVLEYLGASDYFVSASSSEGLPNTVMEALAVGLPVVLSDIQPHREILQYNSNVGMTFDLGDVVSLSESINAVCDGSYSARSDSARSLITENLSSNEMSNQYMEMYENIAKNRALL
ncbi:glycosyltransferase family 4 protein [Halopiger xanaduensis]|uniref:Glycosyl transferase group 1 n=1 Tax=Halopiger xanaduensis (strain DSM 18323 / JCM 14033 / SH-6) TaxID=797210 RepID=F8DA29_HALXS|nr:glycosyltransferase family 4 protein [Halopiger xanaduensis]AEH36947.1 glycosyl transferase group 1 [Halopiger xanaduensis SH-6]